MPKPVPAPVRYVMMVVLDPVQARTVGITKLKGPEQLLKKITFPGGKIEAGESILDAASREMAEETGVRVDPSAWTLFQSVATPDYELHKLVAVSDQVHLARQLEEEPVWLLDCAHHAEFAQKQPGQYVADFLSSLQDAMAAKNLPLLTPSRQPRPVV